MSRRYLRAAALVLVSTLILSIAPLTTTAATAKDDRGTGPLGRVLDLAEARRGVEARHVTQLDPLSVQRGGTEAGIYIPYEVVDGAGTFTAVVFQPTDGVHAATFGILEPRAGESLLTTWTTESASWEAPIAATNTVVLAAPPTDQQEMVCGLIAAYLLFNVRHILAPFAEIGVGDVVCWVLLNPLGYDTWWVDRFRGAPADPVTAPPGAIHMWAAYRVSSDSWCSNHDQYAGRAFLGDNGISLACLVQARQFDPLSGWKVNPISTMGRLIWPDGVITVEHFGTQTWVSTNPYFNGNNDRWMNLRIGSYKLSVVTRTRGTYEFDGSSPITYHDFPSGSVTKSLTVAV